MMRNASNDNFDIVVVYDISRFARDGADIIESARTLKRAFNKTVERAMPSADKRKKLLNEKKRVEKRLAQNQKEIQRLVNAVTKGARVSLLLDNQNRLEEEKELLAKRFHEVETDLANMPSAQQTKEAAAITRHLLAWNYRYRDWRSLSHDEVQRLLFHLFGEQTPLSQNGAFVKKNENGSISIIFKGKVDFLHTLNDGKPIDDPPLRLSDTWDEEAYKEWRKRIEPYTRPFPVDSAIGVPQAQEGAFVKVMNQRGESSCRNLV